MPHSPNLKTAELETAPLIMIVSGTGKTEELRESYRGNRTRRAVLKRKNRELQNGKRWCNVYIVSDDNERRVS